ncbi:Protein disulfide-isomerase A6 [Seminavis robusta]|uniref:Sulfhydryl oxidase n=1 Tax=Seminavis robusta TaxID=568900 RepID=A0A9N8HWG9_9STRA|nr:Protein disulfide-isomerase A6 [Seminavis robusta]|eukprot:Sro2174_g317700.1 Protein disulfide-isomerase A6 (828) ;mRNA; r:9855-12525
MTRPLLRSLVLLSLVLQVVASGVAGEEHEEHDDHEFLYANPQANAPVMDFLPATGRWPSRGDFRHSRNAKMVEFYNPFCGACQSYKPTYLKLARALKDRVGDHIDIFAVSCQVHKELCDQFNVDELPIVALFKAGAATPDNQRSLRVPEKKPDFILNYLFQHKETARALEEEDGEAAGEENEEDNNNESEDENDDGGGNENKESGEEDEDDDDDKEGEGGGENENEDNEGENDAQEGGNDNQEENDDGAQGEEGAGANEEENGDDEYDRKGNGKPVDGEEVEVVDGDQEVQEEEDEEEEQQQADVYEDETQLDRDAAEANRDWFENLAFDALKGSGRLEGRLGGDGAGGDPMGIIAMRRGAAGAGAIEKLNHASDMDRFREAMMKRQSQKISSVFRRESPGAAASRLKEEKIDRTTGATHAMKAHTPGTPEYELRQKKMEAHMNTVMKQKRLRTTAPAMRTFSAGAGGVSRIELPRNHKPLMPYKKEVRKQKLVHEMAGKVPIVRRMVKLSHEEALILDASLSFHNALKTGLFSDDNPLSKHKKRAFQTWLDLLRISLPPEWGLHEMIMDLDNNIDFISQSDKNLHRFLKKHALPRHEWSRGCTKNGHDKRNGFNCGFWKLLHVASVGIAEHRGGINLIEANLVSHEARVFSPLEAADAMKEFIANFFPCQSCRSHFVADYDECSNRRCVRLTDSTEDASFADWQELSKWLWEVHNSVNIRLYNERNKERHVSIHDEVSALFPSVEDCVSCFLDDGGYDEESIFLFLENEYWPGASDIDPAADKLLTFHNVEYAGFVSSWVILLVGIGLIYMLRPRGVLKGQKTRSD